MIVDGLSGPSGLPAILFQSAIGNRQSAILWSSSRLFPHQQGARRVPPSERPQHLFTGTCTVDQAPRQGASALEPEGRQIRQSQKPLKPLQPQAARFAATIVRVILNQLVGDGGVPIESLLSGGIEGAAQVDAECTVLVVEVS